MKTMMVVCPRNVNKHVGETYDSILEVEDQPTTESIQEWANRIKDGIRGLWAEQTREGAGDAKVVVTLDALVSYDAILKNLQIIMKADEGIVIELPYAKARTVDNDPETLDMLRRLGEKI